jgi:hypothetical protein
MTANGQMAATSPRGTSCGFGGSFFISFHFVGGALMGHLISNVDSPRPVVPVPTAMRMPGSFGCGDGDDEVDRLILGIRELGVKD